MTEDSKENISTTLLELIRCPATHSRLGFASNELVERLNRLVEVGELMDQQGSVIEIPFSTGLVNEDESLFFVVRGGIVRLVAGEAIKL